MKRLLLLFAAAAVAVVDVNAAVSLPALLGDHMVLQRQQPIHLWGWADPGETVSAELNGKSQSTQADKTGRWSIFLPAFESGGPYQLAFKGTNAITLNDVLIGDVWFASGQSNMEMPLKGFPGSAVVSNADEEIRNATHGDIRLFRTPRRATNYPQADFDAKWTTCTPETAADFSAVAYFFGREIARDEKVPVGLIDSTWGGTPAEAWISMQGIASDSSLMPVFAEWATMADGATEAQAIARAEKSEDERAQREGKPKPVHPWHPAPESWMPANLYNGMVAAALNFRIKGVIWYQGESNAALQRANLYDRVFPALVADWRSHWLEGNFPFLYVQISAYDAGPHQSYQTVREAQRRTLEVTNTGMTVTIDIGQEHNVHPPDKQDVGHRLALAAKALAYGQQLEYSGPMFHQTSVEGSNLRVWFTHTTGGLKTNGGEPAGFEVAGADHQFVPAKAQIDGDTVLLSAAGVSTPKFARYGWANWPSPALNLFNGENLPASPFTSEPQIPMLVPLQ